MMQSHSGNSQLSWLPAATFMLVFLALNAATIEEFPIAWGDEVMFTEPAANLALDGAFVSRSWPYQSEKETFAGNAPLHSLVLSGWIWLFGLSIVSVRLFGFALILAAGTVLVVTMVSSRAVTSKTSATAGLVLALFTYGLGLNYRSGRYDAIGILLVAVLALLIFGRGSIRQRTLWTVVVSALLPVAGLQLVVGTGAACAAGLLVWRRSAILPALTIVSSMALGLAVMAGVFDLLGVLDTFRYTAGRLKDIASGSFPKDPSLPPLLLAALVLSAVRRPADTAASRDALKFLWLLALGVPLILRAVGRFPTYYTWMSILPLCAIVALLAAGSWRSAFTGSKLRPAAVSCSAALCALAALMGLPLQVASAVAYGPDRDYRQIEALVASSVRPDDRVMVDPSAWYAVRSVAAKTYTTVYDEEDKLMSAEERGAIGILIIRPEQRGQTVKRLGGDWRQVASTHPPARTSFGPLRRNFGDKLVETYSLVVLRREPA